MPLNASGSGHVEMRPRCGLMPTRCVQAAGMRTLPAPSDPIAAVTRPAATAAALPPDDPPGVWLRDHGFRVCPNAGPLVNGHWPSSQVLVLPTMTAPAVRSLRTTSASATAVRTRPAAPNIVGTPAMSTSSLTAIGIPNRGERSPAARLRSARAASASACLRSTTRNALSVGWLASMASSDCCTSSTEVTLPLASRYSWPVRVGRGALGVVTAGDMVVSAINFDNIPAPPTGRVRTRWETGLMRLYRDRAVVLRQHKLGEADRIVTLLTRDHGLVRAVAKGVRRTRSKFGSRLEPFAHIDVQLHPGRNLDIVTQVVSIDAFATDIVNDYGRYTCACAVLETAERLAGEERAPVPALHRLTVAALRAVADGGRPRELVLDAYLLRAMGIAGWAPALIECARCATPGPHRAFHVAAGGSVCVHCRPSGSATPPQGVLDLMAALHDGDWEHAQVSPQSYRTQASGLVAAHLQWHLERQLRTLPLVERVYRVDRAVAEHRISLFGQDVIRGDETGGQDHVPT